MTIISKILSIVIPLLLSVAYFTLAERKILGSIQRRRGPNVIGTFGLLQPLADGFKLLVKETVVPSSASQFIFLLAPVSTFVLSILGWGVIPYNETAVLADIHLGLIYLFAISALSVYGIIMSGWASNSKYAFLGALRSAAQMVSYEVSIGFIVICVVVCAGSFNLTDIIDGQRIVWYFVPLLPMFFLFFISVLAETNRHPFDLPEAESELVSGYNVEYSAMGFALFFLGEYANMLLMSALTTILFLGGWKTPFFYLIPQSLCFGIKICVFIVLFIAMRAALPRFRYDQLMYIGWKIFLPFSIGYLVLCFSVLYSINGFIH